MLALKLRPKEIIHIGDTITIYAGKIGRASGVPIAIEAPKDVPIWREKCEPRAIETMREAQQ